MILSQIWQKSIVLKRKNKAKSRGSHDLFVFYICVRHPRQILVKQKKFCLIDQFARKLERGKNDDFLVIFKNVIEQEKKKIFF